jgi:hypothetical protein
MQRLNVGQGRPKAAVKLTVMFHAGRKTRVGLTQIEPFGLLRGSLPNLHNIAISQIYRDSIPELLEVSAFR